MIVLGIDPSFTATGYAIVSKSGNKQYLLSHGSIPLSNSKILSERIGLFFESIDAIIKKYKITVIAIETPFLGKNAQIFLKLGYLRGVLHLLAHQNKISVTEFSPREVKLAITGFGGAEKEQVLRMVHMLFPHIKAVKSFDVTDAIAIGMCGLWKL